MFNSDDLENPDHINYVEYLVACYQEEMLSEENLEIAFQWLDSNTKGYLTV